MERFENIGNKDGFYVYHTVIDGATAGNYSVIFNVIKPCEVVEVSESHTTAGSVDSTLNIERLSGAEALDTGDEILKTAFDTTSTANTVVSKKGYNDLQNRTLKTGDRIALKDAGTLTALVGVCVTIYLKPLGKGDYR